MASAKCLHRFDLWVVSAPLNWHVGSLRSSAGGAAGRMAWPSAPWFTDTDPTSSTTLSSTRCRVVSPVTGMLCCSPQTLTSHEINTPITVCEQRLRETSLYVGLEVYAIFFNLFLFPLLDLLPVLWLNNYKMQKFELEVVCWDCWCYLWHSWLHLEPAPCCLQWFEVNSGDNVRCR